MTSRWAFHVTRATSVSVCLFVAGCASVPPAQVGQVAGTMAGATLIPGIGAPLGGLVGLLAGMVVQGQVDKITEKRERKELSQQLDVPLDRPPADLLPSTSGEPTRVWVDETVRDGRIVAGHFDLRS